MPRTPLLPSDPQRVGGYWLAGRLGAGGQGVVYEAYGESGERVAVKVPRLDDPVSRARLAKEVAAARRVASFCTARVIEARTDLPEAYVVSEYVPGPNLRQVIDRSGPYGGDLLVRLAIGVATALTAIHRVGIVHRDLKPDNIILGQDGPRVIDFGIARQLGVPGTTVGPMMGTPGYMAPELFAGHDATAAADIWAWGMTVLFAATGHDPLPDQEPMAVVTRVLDFRPDLGGLAHALREPVARALEREPESRPSARDLLLGLLGGLEESRPAPSTSPGGPYHRDATPPADDVLLADGGGAASWVRPPRTADAFEPDLGTTAEELYQELSDGERAAAPEIFLRMVDASGGDDEVIRSVPRDELPGADDEGPVSSLLALYGAAGLVVETETAFTLTHPALIQAWPRLREWVAEERDGLPVHRRLTQAARAWERHGRKPGDLLHGSALDRTLDWAAGERRNVTLIPLEGAFLSACTAAARRGARRRRTVLAALSVLLVISLVAAGLAVLAQRNADRQRDIALSRQLAAQSELLADDPPLSALLAATAWKFDRSPEARAAMLGFLSRPGRAVLAGSVGMSSRMAFSPDGHTLAIGADEGTVRLWDVGARRRVGAPLTGQTGVIISVAFSPDGRLLATVDDDGVVWLRDVGTRRQVASLPTSTDAVRSVAFSPDGRILATGDDHGVVRLWEVGTYRRIGAPLTGHTGIVYSVAFSPDGRTLVTGAGDRGVRLWDMRTHRQIGAPFTGHTDEVLSVVFSPDGRRLASVDADGAARLWDVGTRRQIGDPLTERTDTVIVATAFSPDGRILATGGESHKVRLRDADSRRHAGGPRPALTDRIFSVAFSPDGRTLATVTNDGAVWLWNVDTRRGDAPLVGHIGIVDSLAFSLDGRTLATAGQDGTVRLWDVGTRRQVSAPFAGRAYAVRSAALSPDGHTLAVGGDDGVRLWEVSTHRQIASLATKSSGQPMAFSPDGRVLAVGDDEGVVRLWDVGARRQTGAPLTGPDGVISSVAFSPDGRILASSDGDAVRLWDMGTRRQVGAPLGTQLGVRSVVFSPDGRILAGGGDDGAVRLWDVGAHEQVASLTGHIGIVYSVAFSPDGRTLASGGEDRTVRLWEVATRRQDGAPLATQRGALSVAFSSDGHTLASGGEDRTVRLWNVDVRRQLGAPLTGHAGMVFSVAFSPDGRTLTTGGDDAVRLWDVAVPADILAAVCAVPGRSLSPAEWAQYVPPGVEFQTVCP
ncbi:WD40 repeat domain-containing serine/threonine protein kinase [Streptosporangium sp. NPDC001559]|uniref:WD40 repeat domain-containing serine/threonine protein kinase n=1 Tax=Streptosporangium sp. NPDC001559 TaxID=3366187 RepID=UPI0036ED2CAD